MNITRRTTRLGLAALLGVVVLGTTAASCDGSKLTEQYKDADRGTTNSGPADVMTFPDGFSNVSAKCDGPNRVYVAFHADAAYAAVSVVPNDPRCK